MSASANDVYRMLGDIEDAARKQLSRCQELRMMLATMPLPKPSKGHPCGLCGVAKTSEQALNDHLYVVHGLDEYAPANLEAVA